MQPFRIVFKLSGTMSDTQTDGAAVVHANEIITTAAMSLGGHSYFQLVNEKALPSQAAKINQLILQDTQEKAIEFESSEHDISIRNGENQKGLRLTVGFSYVMTFELTSVEYNCVQILTNNIFVCYRDESKEIKFFSPDDYTRAIVVS